jgi:hypothetical protein
MTIMGDTSPAALSDGINTNWLCGMGTDLRGNTGGKERDRLIPLVAASALMGTLTGGGATHPLSSTASATATAAKKARPRINIGTPQKNLLPKYRRCELQFRKRRFKPLVVPVKTGTY